MKRIAVIGLMVFTALAIGFAGQAMARECNRLAVGVSSSGSVPWRVVDSSVTCVHGKKQWTNSQGYFVWFETVGLFGPDCKVTFVNSANGKKATYRFQQNYCVAAAGDITVQKISGETLHYRADRGDYPGHHGSVHIMP